MKKSFFISEIKEKEKEKEKEKKEDSKEKQSEDKICLQMGMPKVTNFSKTERYFYYGWKIYNGKIEIRRRERVNGNLMKVLLLDNKKTYDMIWNDRENLIYFNI